MLLHLFRRLLVDVIVDIIIFIQRWIVAPSIIGDAATDEHGLVGNLQDKVGPAHIEHLQDGLKIGLLWNVEKWEIVSFWQQKIIQIFTKTKQEV